MNRLKAFTQRNFKEMLRDPIIYIFCAGFPLAMLLLFTVINSFVDVEMPLFAPKSLTPAICMFSFTFVMLTMALLVSKDKRTAFLLRLYTSPMKSHEFVLGYAIPGILIAIVQAVCCMAFGAVVTLITGQEYLSFAACCLVVLSQIPMMFICVFAGILFGSLLNEKSAPAICSLFISAGGVLGGCWMPLDTMNGFNTFCSFLPFYPSVTLGRICSGATHTMGTPYAFDSDAVLGLIVLAAYLILTVVASFLTFKAQMREKN